MALHLTGISPFTLSVNIPWFESITNIREQTSAFHSERNVLREINKWTYDAWDYFSVFLVGR